MSKAVPNQLANAQPQTAMSIADIITQTSHQVLLFSSQGQGRQKEVGFTQGQSNRSQASINDTGICQYNFLNVQAMNGYDLFGTIVECDIDYSFYNTVNNFNNLMYVSIGAFADIGGTNPANYLGVLRIPEGVWTPNEYAEQVQDTMNAFYKSATGSVVDYIHCEYVQSIRRFRFMADATPENLVIYLYDMYPVAVGGSSPVADSINKSNHKAMGLRRNTGQTVPNNYTNEEQKYGKIGYWEINISAPPAVPTFTTPACIDLRRTDAIQIGSTYDASTRNSNRQLAEETNIITSIAVPAILKGDEDIPSTLTFKPNDFSYRSSIKINASNLNKLTLRLTDLDGNQLDMNGGSYTIRMMIYQMPRENLAFADARMNTLDSYIASLPQFKNRGLAGTVNIKPPESWVKRLKKITLQELKHKYLQ